MKRILLFLVALCLLVSVFLRFCRFNYTFPDVKENGSSSLYSVKGTYSDSPTSSEKDEYLILINSDNPLKSEYAPDDLKEIKSTREDGREIQKMRRCAASALEAMIDEMKVCGVYDEKLSVTSGYRSFEYQKYLFDLYIKNRTDSGMSYDEALREVSKTTAKPGCSEHQSGLCVDLHNKPYANLSFADTEQYKWIEKNAHRFGFIVRYPDGRENITGISFEPWHLRYVGASHAQKMFQMQLTLEEYLNLFFSDEAPKKD